MSHQRKRKNVSLDGTKKPLVGEHRSELLLNGEKANVAKWIKKLLVFLCAIYCLPLIFLCLSATFRHQLVFLNYVKNPFANYNQPEDYGLPGSLNIYVKGNSGMLGVWQIPARGSSSIDDGKPIILYIHGNAFARVARHRVGLYKVLTSLGCHVIAYDHRGYGDSDGKPSEKGLIEDSVVMFEWIKLNTKNQPIFVWGHSLGSAVAVALSNILSKKETDVKGLILESPFINMRDAAFNHPLATPYRFLPYFTYAFQEINEMFKSDEKIREVKYNILFLHDHNDIIVKFASGKKLYNEAMNHKTAGQLIEFKEFTGFSHTRIYISKDLPDILRSFMMQT
ncbi:lysophosphatidylserine lipase ABHD12-like [Xenia sp. Carnegie-2017]|uniref:lysophosphatidylserine lipase ABHD12-like n=1 Tax=Xenia sp. Carnegie-2017 TaxID=2897299 RepID=UPI001F039285|nr:lysophosphatidylserine lipase ABHD12-like [Xenia sp. Carnegie-2017]